VDEMSISTASVVTYGQNRGVYAENVQNWLNQAYRELGEKRLSGEADRILGIEFADLFITANKALEVETNDVGGQLALLALAMSCGTRFEFPNGEQANGWIDYFIYIMEGGYQVDLRNHLNFLQDLTYRQNSRWRQ
jgi:hypothetical protein